MIENQQQIRVASLANLQCKGVIVVHGADRPIAVYAHDGRVTAVDNRCPHLGFPLHLGSVQDGLLTCHWHHARFDLCSGCAFDLWADDIPAFDVEVRDGEVYVAALPRQQNPREHLLRRLCEGMEQSISLIQAKSLIGLLKAGVDYRDIVREVALYGVKHRDDWASGLTILTAMANLVPNLDEETAYLALYQGTRRVAIDCADQPSRRELRPLETGDLTLETLKRWLRYWTMVRHRDGAERTVLTAIASGATPTELADLIFGAVTDRFYADAGHLLDFCNKAFELLDLIGWEHAAAVLPALTEELVTARGGEETDSWRHPVDLVPLVRQATDQLPELLREGQGRSWNEIPALADSLLGDDPLPIIAGLCAALRAGAQPEQLARALACAAAVRLAQFGTVNEFGDWITALHTFTYCNALHQVIKRQPSVELLRGVFHGAIAVYLDRFLNVPPARLPGDDASADSEPLAPESLREQFLSLLDQREQVEPAARVVARYARLVGPRQVNPAVSTENRTIPPANEVRSGDPHVNADSRMNPAANDARQATPALNESWRENAAASETMRPLFDVLTRAVVREDADFHTFQMVEAGIRQYHQWQGQPQGEVILVAVARFLAAHSPTQRSQLQTADIALRLHRGDSLYE